MFQKVRCFSGVFEFAGGEGGTPQAVFAHDANYLDKSTRFGGLGLL